MTSWTDVLDSMVASLEAAEESLRTGEWLQIPSWSPPADLPPPGPDELAQARDVLQRLEHCRTAIGDAMSRAGGELSSARGKRTAVRAYSASQSLESVL